ncbi:hypothetical protein B7494_g2939 [Chlorociboria aeruginascens]|nr:hypothetical protein B7494_g2939 [Chlorociboria aeruginascens]
MRINIILSAVIAASLVTAHGKIAVITGDQGGNTTALGIQGAIVPGAGPNSKTEVDTTVFKSTNAATDGLGSTTGGGANTLAKMAVVVAQSGNTLPQVSDGGSVSGTVHIVTTDGAGPYTAIIDSTGQGIFSQGTQATVTTQVPGTKGNIAAPKQRRFVPRMLVKMGIMKRAANVNEDFPFAATIPAGTTCTGTVGAMQNVCLMKIVNPSNAGPFGGVIAFQMAGTTCDTAGNSTATTIGAAATSTKSTKRPVSAKFRM